MTTEGAQRIRRDNKILLFEFGNEIERKCENEKLRTNARNEGISGQEKKIVPRLKGSTALLILFPWRPSLKVTSFAWDTDTFFFSFLPTPCHPKISVIPHACCARMFE